jgi:hypothetical protein
MALVFTEEEWDTLRLLPFVVFHRVACADGQVQREEAEALVEELRSTAFCGDPLRRELSREILTTNFSTLLEEAADGARWQERVVEARHVLRRHLDDAAYRRFAGHVVRFALRVALAAERGDGVLTKTPDEEEALVALARDLGLDVEDLRAEETRPE